MFLHAGTSTPSVHYSFSSQLLCCLPRSSATFWCCKGAGSQFSQCQDRVALCLSCFFWKLQNSATTMNAPKMATWCWLKQPRDSCSCCVFKGPQLRFSLPPVAAHLSGKLFSWAKGTDCSYQTMPASTVWCPIPMVTEAYTAMKCWWHLDTAASDFWNQSKHPLIPK